LKLRREARILKGKALASLRRAAGAFNSYDEDGRVTSVLLHLQHSFEMLVKSALVQRRVRVFDPKDGKSLGVGRCVNLGVEHIGLTEPEAGTIRAIDAMRDEEQHWFAVMSEGLLYAHTRAAVTLFDDILQRVFDERLAAHLPLRVLPISAEPPRDIQILIDDEYTQIRQLLRPGNRRGPDARARIRSLLAMEAHVAEDVLVSRKDVARVEKAIRAGKERKDVFPRLANLATDLGGDGVTVTVRFTKKSGAPVTYVAADDPAEAAAVREVDLQRKFHWSKGELADRLGLTQPKALSLRRYLGIEDDDQCRHDFVFGRSVHRQYSDNAFTKMKEALATTDMNAVWSAFRPGKRG